MSGKQSCGPTVTLLRAMCFCQCCFLTSSVSRARFALVKLLGVPNCINILQRRLQNCSHKTAIHAHLRRQSTSYMLLHQKKETKPSISRSGNIFTQYCSSCQNILVFNKICVFVSKDATSFLNVGTDVSMLVLTCQCGY